jgi:hypothetical protein
LPARDRAYAAATWVLPAPRSPVTAHSTAGRPDPAAPASLPVVARSTNAGGFRGISPTTIGPGSGSFGTAAGSEPADLADITASAPSMMSKTASPPIQIALCAATADGMYPVTTVTGIAIRAAVMAISAAIKPGESPRFRVPITSTGRIRRAGHQRWKGCAG